KNDHKTPTRFGSGARVESKVLIERDGLSLPVRGGGEDSWRGRADGQELTRDGDAVVENFDKSDPWRSFVRQLVINLEVPIVHKGEKEGGEIPFHTTRGVSESRRQWRAAGRLAGVGSGRKPRAESREDLARSGGARKARGVNRSRSAAHRSRINIGVGHAHPHGEVVIEDAFAGLRKSVTPQLQFQSESHVRIVRRPAVHGEDAGSIHEAAPGKTLEASG